MATIYQKDKKRNSYKIRLLELVSWLVMDRCLLRSFYAVWCHSFSPLSVSFL